MMHNLKTIGRQTILGVLLVLAFTSLGSAAALAGTVCGDVGGLKVNGKDQGIQTSIDIGCTGHGNPIIDMLFAVIRFLSAGVGLVVIGSIIYGGIQYTASRGDPQATAKAVTRIRSSVIALIIFIFGYAILNYLIPGGFIHP